MFGTKIKKRQAKIISLLNSLPECTQEEKKQRVHTIQVLHALELFDMKRYSQALNEFIKLNTDPSEVIKLFPDIEGNPNDEKVEVKKIKGKDIETAFNALIEYLLKIKKSILQKTGGSCNKTNEIDDKSDVKQKLEIIDTALLKCYLENKKPLIVPLIRANNCNLEESEKALLHYGKYSELVILYQIKGQHLKALELLKEQAKRRDSFAEGYQCTTIYLQQLGPDHLDLIIKFSDWILKDHPGEGLKIFTADIETVKQLPRPHIFNFLLKEHKCVVIPYLEHVIHTWKDTNPVLHDALIDEYREKLVLNSEDVAEEELKNTKSKLLSLLEESTSYTPRRVLSHLPKESLFEERAIVLGKLGRHEQALAIYVLILDDIDQALRYSEKVSASSKEHYPDVFVSLLRIILNPEKCDLLSGPLANIPRQQRTSADYYEIVLNILEKHVHRISPLKALSVLPDDVPLISLKNFFVCSMEGHATLKRRTQILKGLAYAENVYVQELKDTYESKSVTINDGDVCYVCRKRFLNQSAFVRYPNGIVVHYSCKLKDR